MPPGATLSTALSTSWPMSSGGTVGVGVVVVVDGVVVVAVVLLVVVDGIGSRSAASVAVTGVEASRTPPTATVADSRANVAGRRFMPGQTGCDRGKSPSTGNRQSHFTMLLRSTGHRQTPFITLSGSTPRRDRTATAPELSDPSARVGA